MKTRNQLKEEFPDLNEAQIGTALQYLEIQAPKGASDPEFRQLVADSISESGNLLCLSRTVEMPLP